MSQTSAFFSLITTKYIVPNLIEVLNPNYWINSMHWWGLITKFKDIQWSISANWQSFLNIDNVGFLQFIIQKRTLCLIITNPKLNPCWDVTRLRSRLINNRFAFTCVVIQMVTLMAYVTRDFYDLALSLYQSCLLWSQWFLPSYILMQALVTGSRREKTWHQNLRLESLETRLACRHPTH